MSQTANRIGNIASLIRTANSNLRKAQKLLESLESDMGGTYDDIPGVLGVFDGQNMITPEGKNYEVNPNYAAKSMLVVGDNLKMVEENGKQLFKQISKVPRKELKGTLTKKEGKWYALTDSGSYRILDVAVDFRRGSINDEVTVVIPEDNTNSAFGALEKLAKDEERPVIDPEKAARKLKEKEDRKRATGMLDEALFEEEEKKEEKPAKPAKVKKSSTKKKPVKKIAPKKEKEEKPKKKVPIKKAAPKKAIESLLDDDDDLV